MKFVPPGVTEVNHAALASPRVERAAAWLVTGPVGHLAAGVADWAALMSRWAWAGARRRLSR